MSVERTHPFIQSEPTKTHGSQALRHVEPWRLRITEAWNHSIRSILETGQHLSKAKDNLDWDEWNTLLALLPFGKRTADRLMAIGRSPLIADHSDKLPQSWRTLYELTKLPEDVFVSALDTGAINTDMNRSEVAKLKPPRLKPSQQEYDVAPDAAYDAASIAKGCIAHLKSQLQNLPPPVASEVGSTVLHWLHEQVEGCQIWHDA